MNKRHITPILFLCFSTLCAYAQPKEKKAYQSLLWEIKSDKTEKPSYLYGTMHVSEKVAFHLSDKFFDGLKSVDAVALEIQPETWLRDMYEEEQEYGSGYFSEGNEDDEVYDNLVNIDLISNDQIEYMLKTDPNIINRLLYRYSAYNANFEENTYLDLFIFQTGKKYGKKVYGLERWKQTNDLVKKAIEAQKKESRDQYRKYERILREQGKSIPELIEDSYRKQDLDFLDSLSRMSSSEGYYKYMIDERNRIMADRMDSIMTSGTSLFTGVGAAHLPAENGVIELLRKKGYTVTPIKKNISSKSMKEKKKSEKIYYNHSMATYVSPDSLISIKAHADPFKYNLKVLGNSNLIPDMVNGGYLSIDKAKTFAFIENQSPRHYFRRVDSLLYENIPGDILKKKVFEENGIIGFDITNKTRRGDIQRVKIAITPLEIIFVKLAGTGKNVSKYSDKVFGGLKFSPITGGWSTYTPLYSGFTVSLPNYRTDGVNVMPVRRGRYATSNKFDQEENVQGFDPADSSFFMVIKNRLIDYNYLEEDTFEIRQLAERFESIEDSLILSTKFTVCDGFPAYQLVSRDKGSKKFNHIRTVVKGNEYFLLFAKTNSELPPAQFFDSFKFSKPVYDALPEVKTDTILKFMVSTVAKIPEENAYTRYYYRDEDENPFEGIFLQKEFEAKTNESIYAQYYKYGKYVEFKTVDSLWNLLTTREIKLNGMRLQKNLISKTDTTFIDEIWVTDTNSSKIVQVKYTLYNEVLYTLVTQFDSTEGPSSFQKEFFSSMKPLADTNNTGTLFQKKSAWFFEDMNSGDSTRMHSAMEVIEDVTFQDTDFDSLRVLIDSLDFEDDFEQDDKTILISIIGTLKNDRALPYIEKQYKATDKSYLQITYLEALSNIQTKASYQLFIELLNFETPLPQSSYELNTLFRNLEDSLDLVTVMYPAMLKFIDYEEYRTLVISLTRKLYEEGLIESSMFASYKDKFHREATNELKRNSAQVESDSYYGYDDYAGYGDSYYGAKTYRNFNAMVDLARLLYPFKNEEKVQRLFEKIMKSDDNESKMSLIAFFTSKGELPDTAAVNSVLKEEVFVAKFYEELLAEDSSIVEKAFPNAYNNQELIYRSVIQNSYSFDPEEDTIAYVGKVHIKLMKSEGDVYFFKTKKEESDEWKLSYIGLADTTKEFLDVDPMISRNNISFNEGKMEEKIKELTRDLGFWDRKYAKPSGKSSYFNMY